MAPTQHFRCSKNSLRQYVNKEIRPRSKKILFAKTGDGADLALRPWSADPWFRPLENHLKDPITQEYFDRAFLTILIKVFGKG